MYEILISGWEESCHRHLGQRLEKDEFAEIPGPIGRRDLGSARANIDYYANVVFNLSRRSVDPVPRKVHRSRVFAADLRCATYQAKIDQVVDFLSRGDSAIDNPAYQLRSRTLETTFHEQRQNIVRDRSGRPKVFQDYMLYDWNVQHFHIEPGRGNHLLFAYLTASDAYLVRIGTHDDFANLAVLEEIEADWPGLLPRLRGVSIPTNPTPKQIADLRKNNVTYVVGVGGAAIHAHALRAADGTPFDVVTSQDRVMQWFRTLLPQLEQMMPQIEKELGGKPDRAEMTVAVSSHVPHPSEIRIEYDGNRVQLEFGPG